MSSDIQRPLLILDPRRCDCLSKVEFGFGVRELLELFDLQAPVFVGHDVCDEDRFADPLNPDRSLCLVDHLWSEYHVNRYIRCIRVL
jgi:hypothetical protein